MTPIRVMMVDDEPLIRKVVKMEMNSRSMNVESGDIDASVTRRVEMVDTFADGPALLAALGNIEPPDYLLVDMEFQGEPTGGLAITRRVHERYPSVRIIIFSGRFDNPQQNAMPDADREQRLHDIGRVVMDALENILRAIACLERGEQCYFNYPVMLTLKEAAERYFAIAANHDPSLSLTPTEHTLLLLEAAGCTASEISDRLGETDKVVQQRQKDLSVRLDIVNKSAARVAKAISLGLVDAADVQFLPRT